MNCDLPAPLLPPDVDLRDFSFMPLDVARLRDSDLAAVVSADAFRAAVLLWCAAWHQIPAASLPADEVALARLAGYGRDLAAWKKVKEGALRGFVLCSDNRLYHAVIAEKALSAWEAKQAQRSRTAAATAARLAKKQQEARDEPRDEAPHDQRDVGRDESRNEPRRQNVTSTKGQGEGDYRSSLRSDQTRAARAAFDREFWPKYPHKVGKEPAAKAFAKLWRELHGDISSIITGLERYCREKPADRPWLNPATFLNQRRFEDQPALSLSASPASSSTSPRIDFGGGVSWPESTVRQQVERWSRQPESWPEGALGPPPGQPGCRVPGRLLEAA